MLKMLLITLIFVPEPYDKRCRPRTIRRSIFSGSQEKRHDTLVLCISMIDNAYKIICSEEAMADPSTLKNIPCRSDFNLAAS